MDEKTLEFESNFSVLDRYGTEITKETYITNPAIGREEEIKELILILLTPEKSAILIGKPGIGKTAIVEGLAYKMQLNEIPEALKGYTIINIKTASLLGTMPSGESKVQKMIDELKTKDKVILFVDEVHMLIGATDSSSLDFANIFKEGLGRGSIKVIGATTTEEYERYILRDKAFTRRFQKVEILEPTREETIKIMMGTMPKFEKQTGRKMKYSPFIQERIMAFLVDISSEYKRVFALGSRYPDVSLTLLKQAFSYTVYDDREYVDIYDIQKAITNTKNIYPDVLKKELPRFEQEFKDIFLEEQGIKEVEEWRLDKGPSRYEQAIAKRQEVEQEEQEEDEQSEEVYHAEEEIKPVDIILSEETLQKFNKIGPQKLSEEVKKNITDKRDLRALDDIILGTPIDIITPDKKINLPKVKQSYVEEDAIGSGFDLLSKPIMSTLDVEEEPIRQVDNSYRSLTLEERELNDKGLVIEKSNKGMFIPDPIRRDEEKTMTEKDFLFGAPMYTVKEEEEKRDNKPIDIFGQLISDIDFKITGGKVIENEIKPVSSIFTDEKKPAKKESSKSLSFGEPIPSILDEEIPNIFDKRPKLVPDEEPRRNEKSKDMFIFEEPKVETKKERVREEKPRKEPKNTFIFEEPKVEERREAIREEAPEEKPKNTFIFEEPKVEERQEEIREEKPKEKQTKFIHDFEPPKEEVVQEKKEEQHQEFTKVGHPNKKYRFLEGFEDIIREDKEKEPKIKQEVIDHQVSQQSKKFLNFEDLNSGKVVEDDINQYVSSSSLTELQDDTSLNDLNNTQSSLSVENNDKETDNYFDDFFDN